MERSDRVNIAKQEVLIKTKVTNEETIKKLVQPAVDFANKHELCFNLLKNNNGDLLAVYEAEGKTSAYCKGMVSEIKQILKDMFCCKIEVLIYLY